MVEKKIKKCIIDLNYMRTNLMNDDFEQMIYTEIEQECVDLETQINLIEKFHLENGYEENNYPHSVKKALYEFKLKRITNLYIMNMMDCFSKKQFTSYGGHLNIFYQLLGYSHSHNLTLILTNLIEQEKLITVYDFVSRFLESIIELIIRKDSRFHLSLEEVRKSSLKNESIREFLQENLNSSKNFHIDFKIKILMNLFNYIISNKIIDNDLNPDEQNVLFLFIDYIRNLNDNDNQKIIYSIFSVKEELNNLMAYKMNSF